MILTDAAKAATPLASALRFTSLVQLRALRAFGGLRLPLNASVFRLPSGRNGCGRKIKEMKMSDNKPNNKPTFALYSVTGDGDAARWSRIGAAWNHKDGDGFSIKLESVPLNGRVVMRREGAEKGGAQ